MSISSRICINWSQHNAMWLNDKKSVFFWLLPQIRKFLAKFLSRLVTRLLRHTHQSFWKCSIHKVYARGGPWTSSIEPVLCVNLRKQVRPGHVVSQGPPFFLLFVLTGHFSAIKSSLCEKGPSKFPQQCREKSPTWWSQVLSREKFCCTYKM